MIICDLCEKEIKPKEVLPKICICTRYVCGSWNVGEFDICPCCWNELREKRKQAEAEFFSKKVEELKNEKRNSN